MGVHTIIPAAVHSTLESQRLINEEDYTTSIYPTKGRGTSHSPSTSTASDRDRGSSGLTIRGTYGSTGAAGAADGVPPDGQAEGSGNGKGKEPALDGHHETLVLDADGEDDADEEDEEEEEEEGEEGEGLDPIIDVTWRYMSRLYLLVPIITLIWLAALILLVTFAWPPSKREKQAGQRYPHPFLWKPFLLGIFASCTVQTIRVPIWEVVSWTGVSSALITFLSTTLHAIIHELLRFSTLPLVTPSPTSGFHSTYYLGLGWGVAEVTWGIVQGWEQLALYQEVMREPSSRPELDVESQPLLQGGRKQEKGSEQGLGLGLGLGLSSVTERSDEDDEGALGSASASDTRGRGSEDDEGGEERGEYADADAVADEAELERRVEILERMRARQDLEEVIGLPFPNIPFPLHLLWRLDTLLLNLGLTLLLAAFYYNPTPIYRHSLPSLASFPSFYSSFSRSYSSSFSNPTAEVLHDAPARTPMDPSPYLWLVWALVAFVHVGVSLVWKVVGRVGVGAVTWGALIVALGSVFAGLGSWGGLV